MLAADTETALIESAKLAPELACITYSDGERAEIVHWQDSYKTARWLLEQEITTANGSFDLAVLWAAHPDLRDLIWEGLVAGRYHDVQTRQKLMDIGAGCYRRVFRKLPGADEVSKLNYSLSDLHARYYGTFMEKDEWRLQYGKLRPLPLESWPEGAKRYATYDAVATARIHDLQDEAALKQGETHNLWDEAPQMRAAFGLYLMSCWGFKTDLKQVERVIGQIDREQPGFAQILLREGLAREKGRGKYSRSEKAAKARMYKAVGDAGELTKTGYEKVKKGLLTKEQALAAGYIKIDEEWCEVSKDPGLIVYYHFRQNQLLRAKLGHIQTAAFYGVPIQTRFEVLMETGRTSSSEDKLIPNSMALQNPPRKPLLDYVKLDKNGNPTPLLDARGVPYGGMRECFIARPGCTLIACDFGQAELVSLAQVTYAAFGYSKMRELLNAGMDIHVDFGKEVLARQRGVKLPYEEAWRLYKAKDSTIKEYRQLAKCFHGATEVLTRGGWVRLDTLRYGVEIAAASFSDGGNTNIQWETPTRLTTRISDELVHLFDKNIDLWVTPDHRMASWNKKNQHVACTPEELGSKPMWPGAGWMTGGTVDIPETLLRLAVATQADGHYHGENEHIVVDTLGRKRLRGYGEKIRFGFTKKRKTDRLRALLSGEAYEEYQTGKNAVDTFILSVETAARIKPLLDPDKTIPWWWLRLTDRCRQIVLDEMAFWDGRKRVGEENTTYFSSIQKNVDVLQAVAAITNKKSSFKGYVSAGRECNFHLSVKDRAHSCSQTTVATRHVWGREVFCVTVPSGAILVRYGGKTVVTMNCADFGFPGGLGWASFQSYAKKAWQVSLTGEEAKSLKIYWLKHFPEMKHYFQWISDLVERGGGKADIQSFMSKRWRGKCFYTQMCNNLFQSLTADAAKHALFEVSRYCYTVRSSALYGCRPLLFVHDEIITEAPKEQAAEAAIEMEKLMVEVYRRYTPDVNITADAHLMDRWSKDAEAVYDERGKLTPWNPPQEEDEGADLELMQAAE